MFNCSDKYNLCGGGSGVIAFGILLILSFLSLFHFINGAIYRLNCDLYARVCMRLAGFFSARFVIKIFYCVCTLI